MHGSGPPFRLPARPAPDARAAGQRQGIQAAQPDQDQQRAAGGRRPGAAVARERPGPAPRAGRPARRPDDRGRQVGPIRRPARAGPSRVEADARELSRPQGGHRYARAARQPARPDRGSVPPLGPRRRARARAPCHPTKIRAGCSRSAPSASPGVRLGWCRAIASSPSGSSSQRAGQSGVLLGVSPRRASVRSCSA